MDLNSSLPDRKLRTKGHAFKGLSYDHTHVTQRVSCSLNTSCLRGSGQAAVLSPPGLGQVPHLIWGPAFRLLRLLLGVRVLDTSNNGGVKHLFEVFLSQSRAFDIGDSFDFLSAQLRRLLGDWLLFAFVQLNEHFDIFSKVRLGPNQDDGGLRAVTPNLRYPLLTDVLEGGGAHHAEAQQEDVCVGVAEGPQLVKLVLKSNSTRTLLLLALTTLVNGLRTSAVTESLSL